MLHGRLQKRWSKRLLRKSIRKEMGATITTVSPRGLSSHSNAGVGDPTPAVSSYKMMKKAKLEETKRALVFGLAYGFISFSFACLVALTICVSGGRLIRVDESGYGSHWVLDLIGSVVVSPLLETIVLYGLFRLFSIFVSPKLATVLSAFSLSIVHGVWYWAWGLITLFPLLIFVRPFLDRSQEVKWRLLRSGLAHSFHNVYVSVLLVVFLKHYGE